jgi:hypothetical protein
MNNENIRMLLQYRLNHDINKAIRIVLFIVSANDRCGTSLKSEYAQ